MLISSLIFNVTHISFIDLLNNSKYEKYWRAAFFNHQVAVSQKQTKLQAVNRLDKIVFTTAPHAEAPIL